MTAKVTFFPVDNGDMTLVTVADGSTILIDCDIRAAADDPEQKTRDVAKDLRARLRRDSRQRPYVDAFLLSHPDTDHSRGLLNHFYLGAPENYPDDKKPDAQKRIFIREMWSSPIVFRRASKTHILSDDANAWASEARRRVALNRKNHFVVAEGDRILVMGEDVDGKTGDLGPILVKAGDVFNRINGAASQYFAAKLLAPLLATSEEEDEELSKNESSVIVNIALSPTIQSPAGVGSTFLTGGDAEVAIWEHLWKRYSQSRSVLQYDLLQTPHHCSWHSLSYDSWSELREDAVVSQDARAALGQMRNNGFIVASCCPIKDDDNDPPCWGAKREYEKIAQAANGRFLCTAEYPAVGVVEPLELAVGDKGFRLPQKAAATHSLLRPAGSGVGLIFPNKPVVPNKPAGFA